MSRVQNGQLVQILFPKVGTEQRKPDRARLERREQGRQLRVRGSALPFYQETQSKRCQTRCKRNGRQHQHFLSHVRPKKCCEQYGRYGDIKRDFLDAANDVRAHKMAFAHPNTQQEQQDNGHYF